MDEKSFARLDLAGKLIIKVQLGEDIRRIPIHNDDITYDELVLMMQRIFRGQLDSKDEVAIKYKDEDGDLITIFDSSDLSFAIQCSRILRITLFVNGRPRPLETAQVKHIREELQEIRDRVNHLVDQLSCEQSDAPVHNHVQSSSMQEQAVDPTVVAHARPPVPVGGSKEFDPLSARAAAEPDEAQQKVMSSFGLQNDGGSLTPVERPRSPGSESTHSANSMPTAQRPGGPPEAPQVHQPHPSQLPPQQQQMPPQQAPYPQQQPTSQPHGPQPGYAGAPAGYPTGAGGPPLQQGMPQGPQVPQQPAQQPAQHPSQPPYAGPTGYSSANSQAYTPTSQYYRYGQSQMGPGYAAGYTQAGMSPSPGGQPGESTVPTQSSNNPYAMGNNQYGQQYPRPQGQYPRPPTTGYQ
ncbi:hypothetical protein CAPTEDRAFT_180567 [Capitella teleta]|uniref:PB1 domain-containing protein n=1 Tax=Capitella teleta TaxID=283909 RepID=R7V6W4_CAPTE|nr:hypothetical protein CAPTEDRAFT_180567 [Capitella teleta]|eukprot:ELU14613.1 hypothetical protein CAPTEDRAFT_180567 [Capitella teleta]